MSMVYTNGIVWANCAGNENADSEKCHENPEIGK